MEIPYALLEQNPVLDNLVGKPAVLTSGETKWFGEVFKAATDIVFRYSVLSGRCTKWDGSNECKYDEKFPAGISVGDTLECEGVTYVVTNKLQDTIDRADELIRKHSPEYPIG